MNLGVNGGEETRRLQQSQRRAELLASNRNERSRDLPQQSPHSDVPVVRKQSELLLGKGWNILGEGFVIAF